MSDIALAVLVMALVAAGLIACGVATALDVMAMIREREEDE